VGRLDRDFGRIREISKFRFRDEFANSIKFHLRSGPLTGYDFLETMVRTTFHERGKASA
jgi:hypothetical protein